MNPDRLLFLTDTDTTVGFLSRDPELLDRAKRRHGEKHYITALPSLRSLRDRARVPRPYRRRLRRSRKESYILPSGHSYRIVRDPRHLLLLKRLEWAYTSSANLSGAAYDEEYARRVADVVVEPLGAPRTPSRIYRLGHRKLRRIR